MDRSGYRKVSGVFTEVETFLFDLDGTLVNSSADIAVAVNYALEKLGFPPMEESQIVKHVGYGGKRLMKGVLNTEDEELINKGISLFREYYFSNPVVYSKLYPGVYEVLQMLKQRGKKIGVVTNKYEDISIEIIKKLKIIDFVDLIVGGDTTPEKKPHPYPVIFALEKLRSKPKKTIIIGDSEADINAGKNAGTHTGFVTYGFGKVAEVLKLEPDFVIHNFGELRELL